MRRILVTPRAPGRRRRGAGYVRAQRPPAATRRRATRSSSTTRSASSPAPTSRSPACARARSPSCASTRRRHRALVDFEITQEGFGSLRKDVFCESRPQSLIGEYYIDCKPGTSQEKLARGSTIPVEQTASTIPLDLVNNVLRKPYRERLAIILDELGIGVAGRAQDINDVIRRASPALRETDKVLEKLARQNETLKQLVTDADAVVGDLAANKRDVGRFVVETKETAAASAERRDDIAAQPAPAADASCASCARRWPRWARPPTPTRPRCANLNASADQLATLLENVKPFAEATQVNLDSLAEAARKGRPAVSAARPVVAELAKATAKAPELANNAAIVLEHLDDRKHAAEKDPRSPGGQGYTGLRGRPAVALRPVAGDQHLRRERLHPQDRPLRLQVQRLPEPADPEGRR